MFKYLDTKNINPIGSASLGFILFRQKRKKNY